jgi:hypothetical protein
MRGKVYAVVTTGMRQVGRPAPLRLTHRGRVVVLAFFILLASLASAVLWTTASRADQSPAAPTVVVQRGDTLWDIAARVAPDRSPRDVVSEIRELNAMHDYYIYAGDTLILPREH